MTLLTLDISLFRFSRSIGSRVRGVKWFSKFLVLDMNVADYKLIPNDSILQCCGAGAAKSRIIWSELEQEP
jgi:hypothetical protein